MLLYFPLCGRQTSIRRSEVLGVIAAGAASRIGAERLRECRKRYTNSKENRLKKGVKQDDRVWKKSDDRKRKTKTPSAEFIHISGQRTFDRLLRADMDKRQRIYSIGTTGLRN